MRYILLVIAMLTSIPVLSQDKYDLFLIEDKSSRGFTENHNLDRINHIYYLKKDSNEITLYNDYLRFEILDDSVSIYWLNDSEGIYKSKLTKTDNQWYILEFIINDSPVYYYFYRRYDFLEKAWN